MFGKPFEGGFFRHASQLRRQSQNEIIEVGHFLLVFFDMPLDKKFGIGVLRIFNREEQFFPYF
ncbi:MAG TPA: hypothetical protein VF335_05885, partial [Chitinivibrionales bacterium]